MFGINSRKRRQLANEAYENAMQEAQKTSRAACDVKGAVDSIMESGTEAIHRFLTGITVEDKNAGHKPHVE